VPPNGGTFSGKLLVGSRGSQELFKKQAGQEPVEKIIKPDHFFDVPSGSFVVPGADFFSHKKIPGKKFTKENTDGIYGSSYKHGKPFQKGKKRSQKTGASVNGKHPQGGLSNQTELSFLQGTKGRKEDFHTPSSQAAF